MKRSLDTLADRSPQAAANFLARLEATFALLAYFPDAGSIVHTRNAKLIGLRRIAVQKFDYYVVYYVSDSDIEIISVLHSARDRDAILEDEF